MAKAKPHNWRKWNEFRFDALNEGPAYEYEKQVKDIEKAENKLAIEVSKLVKLLTKKGLKPEALEVSKSYMKPIRGFKNLIDSLVDKLL